MTRNSKASLQHQKQDCFTLEHGTDRLSHNVGNYQPKQRNIPGEQRSDLRRDRSLKSRQIRAVFVTTLDPAFQRSLQILL